jgi:uncharacterized protein (DUF1800 family)
VVEVSRAFTGWTHSAARKKLSPFGMHPDPVTFRFDSATHDAEPKIVLGHTLVGGRGIEDGEQVLDILAKHPSTARFIARKLAIRFVSDSPPASLIDRAALTFTRTDGDIREVLRTIVTSPEFFSPEVHGVKIKSPQELLLSTRRALAAPIDFDAELIDFLIDMDQRPYGYTGPEGWPETGARWLNLGSMIGRFDMANRIGRGEAVSIPLEKWPGWSALVDQPFEKQVDGVLRLLLNGRPAPDTRAALIAARPESSGQADPEARRRALGNLVAMALASPQFQRR